VTENRGRMTENGSRKAEGGGRIYRYLRHPCRRKSGRLETEMEVRSGDRNVTRTSSHFSPLTSHFSSDRNVTGTGGRRAGGRNRRSDVRGRRGNSCSPIMCNCERNIIFLNLIRSDLMKINEKKISYLRIFQGMRNVENLRAWHKKRFGMR